MPFSGQLWGSRGGNSAANADSQQQNDLLAVPGGDGPWQPPVGAGRGAAGPGEPLRPR